MDTMERTRPNTEAATTNGNLTTTLNHLIEADIESDKTLYSAAEHIDNRGMKLLLKTYAQQHAQFTAQLQDVVRQMGDNPPVNRDPVTTMSRGLTDVKAAMTVKRQDRQQVALTDALQSENTTVNAYTEALNTSLPERVRELVTRQAERARTIQNQIKLMSGESSRRLVIRLYDQADEAARVVNQLQQAGFAADEIYSAPIEQATRVYSADPEERGRTKQQTVFAMSMAGAGVGLVLGVLLGIAQRWLAPNTLSFLPSSGVAVAIIIGVIVAVIGAIFGTIFGLLIGQDKSEEDAYLYTESLKEGDTLLVVFTDSRNKAEAEQIIGLKHQREIAPGAGREA
ncbi:MAG: PA2169 family four-helix-bundle protein [Caldilineaceae bacterium]